MEHSKTCPVCSVIRQAKDFYKDSSKKDGLSWDCKTCKKSRVKSWRLNNTEKHRTYSNHWYYANKDHALQKSKEWVEANSEKVTQYKKKYAENNKETFRAKTLRRRAILKQASLYLVRPKDIQKLLAKDCLYCGAKSQHIDHIIPLSRGGQHSLGNLVGSCQRCNTSKGGKLIMEWRITSVYRNCQISCAREAVSLPKSLHARCVLRHR